MNIYNILDDVYGFEQTACCECNFRFGCYTSQGSCCPLKVIRLVKNGIEFPLETDYHIEINYNLGKFDYGLLARIGKGLAEAYEIQRGD